MYLGDLANKKREKQSIKSAENQSKLCIGPDGISSLLTFLASCEVIPRGYAEEHVFFFARTGVTRTGVTGGLWPVNRFFITTVIVGVDPHCINFFSVPAVRQPHKGGILEWSKDGGRQ